MVGAAFSIALRKESRKLINTYWNCRAIVAIRIGLAVARIIRVAVAALHKVLQVDETGILAKKLLIVKS